MILTNCAACAAPLAHNAPRCIRCKTRYCDATCQHDHWRRGHKQICKKIHRGGNAEQYNADKKYKQAVAVAVEACRGRHEGQKCYICLEAVHPHTGEGLVRGCACGDRDGVSSPELGVAHVSCLARQAKELVAEAWENNLFGTERFDERWRLWSWCSLCEQDYHGVVRCALGWACWKTYLGRPEADRTHGMAMSVLGNGLFYADYHEDAVSVTEAELAMMRRLGDSEHNILIVQGNISSSYAELGRHEEALRIEREVYARRSKLYGTDEDTLLAAVNLASCLVDSLQQFDEARAFLLDRIPESIRILGKAHDLTFKLQRMYAQCLYQNDGASRSDLTEAVAKLGDLDRRQTRIYGAAHPQTSCTRRCLAQARKKLARA